jgi:hypothetical protein
MKNFWKKFNELIFSPLAILVFGLAYYGVYYYFGPEAGLIPPGYFTNILAGAAVMYIAGFMASVAVRLNFPEKFKILFDDEDYFDKQEIVSLCVYFCFYALSIWALTSML